MLNALKFIFYVVLNFIVRLVHGYQRNNSLVRETDTEKKLFNLENNTKNNLTKKQTVIEEEVLHKNGVNISQHQNKKNFEENKNTVNMEELNSSKNEALGDELFSLLSLIPEEEVLLKSSSVTNEGGKLVVGGRKRIDNPFTDIVKSRGKGCARLGSLHSKIEQTSDVSFKQGMCSKEIKYTDFYPLTKMLCSKNDFTSDFYWKELKELITIGRDCRAEVLHIIISSVIGCHSILVPNEFTKNGTWDGELAQSVFSASYYDEKEEYEFCRKIRLLIFPFCNFVPKSDDPQEPLNGYFITSVLDTLSSDRVDDTTTVLDLALNMIEEASKDVLHDMKKFVVQKENENDFNDWDKKKNEAIQKLKGILINQFFFSPSPHAFKKKITEKKKGNLKNVISIVIHLIRLATARASEKVKKISAAVFANKEEIKKKSEYIDFKNSSAENNIASSKILNGELTPVVSMAAIDSDIQLQNDNIEIMPELLSSLGIIQNSAEFNENLDREPLEDCFNQLLSIDGESKSTEEYGKLFSYLNDEENCSLNNEELLTNVRHQTDAENWELPVQLGGVQLNDESYVPSAVPEILFDYGCADTMMTPSADLEALLKHSKTEENLEKEETPKTINKTPELKPEKKSEKKVNPLLRFYLNCLEDEKYGEGNYDHTISGNNEDQKHLIYIEQLKEQEHNISTVNNNNAGVDSSENSSSIYVRDCKEKGHKKQICSCAMPITLKCYEQGVMEGVPSICKNLSEEKPEHLPGDGNVSGIVVIEKSVNGAGGFKSNTASPLRNLENCQEQLLESSTTRDKRLLNKKVQSEKSKATPDNVDIILGPWARPHNFCYYLTKKERAEKFQFLRQQRDFLLFEVNRLKQFPQWQTYHDMFLEGEFCDINNAFPDQLSESTKLSASGISYLPDVISFLLQFYGCYLEMLTDQIMQIATKQPIFNPLPSLLMPPREERHIDPVHSADLFDWRGENLSRTSEHADGLEIGESATKASGSVCIVKDKSCKELHAYMSSPSDVSAEKNEIVNPLPEHEMLPDTINNVCDLHTLTMNYSLPTGMQTNSGDTFKKPNEEDAAIKSSVRKEASVSFRPAVAVVTVPSVAKIVAEACKEKVPEDSKKCENSNLQDPKLSSWTWRNSLSIKKSQTTPLSSHDIDLQAFPEPENLCGDAVIAALKEKLQEANKTVDYIVTLLEPIIDSSSDEPQVISFYEAAQRMMYFEEKGTSKNADFLLPNNSLRSTYSGGELISHIEDILHAQALVRAVLHCKEDNNLNNSETSLKATPLNSSLGGDSSFFSLAYSDTISNDPSSSYLVCGNDGDVGLLATKTVTGHVAEEQQRMLRFERENLIGPNIRSLYADSVRRSAHRRKKDKMGTMERQKKEMLVSTESRNENAYDDSYKYLFQNPPPTNIEGVTQTTGGLNLDSLPSATRKEAEELLLQLAGVERFLLYICNKLHFSNDSNDKIAGELPVGNEKKILQLQLIERQRSKRYRVDFYVLRLILPLLSSIANCITSEGLPNITLILDALDPLHAVAKRLYKGLTAEQSRETRLAIQGEQQTVEEMRRLNQASFLGSLAAALQNSRSSMEEFCEQNGNTIITSDIEKLISTCSQKLLKVTETYAGVIVGFFITETHQDPSVSKNAFNVNDISMLHDSRVALLACCIELLALRRVLEAPFSWAHSDPPKFSEFRANLKRTEASLTRTIVHDCSSSSEVVSEASTPVIPGGPLCGSHVLSLFFSSLQIGPDGLVPASMTRNHMRSTENTLPEAANSEDVPEAQNTSSDDFASPDLTEVLPPVTGSLNIDTSSCNSSIPSLLTHCYDPIQSTCTSHHMSSSAVPPLGIVEKFYRSSISPDGIFKFHSIVGLAISGEGERLLSSLRSIRSYSGGTFPLLKNSLAVSGTHANSTLAEGRNITSVSSGASLVSTASPALPAEPVAVSGDLHPRRVQLLRTLQGQKSEEVLRRRREEQRESVRVILEKRLLSDLSFSSAFIPAGEDSISYETYLYYQALYSCSMSNSELTSPISPCEDFESLLHLFGASNERRVVLSQEQFCALRDTLRSMSAALVEVLQKEHQHRMHIMEQASVTYRLTRGLGRQLKRKFRRRTMSLGATSAALKSTAGSEGTTGSFDFAPRSLRQQFSASTLDQRGTLGSLLVFNAQTQDALLENVGGISSNGDKPQMRSDCSSFTDALGHFMHDTGTNSTPHRTTDVSVLGGTSFSASVNGTPPIDFTAGGDNLLGVVMSQLDSGYSVESSVNPIGPHVAEVGSSVATDSAGTTTQLLSITCAGLDAGIRGSIGSSEGCDLGRQIHSEDQYPGSHILSFVQHKNGVNTSGGEISYISQFNNDPSNGYFYHSPKVEEIDFNGNWILGDITTAGAPEVSEGFVSIPLMGLEKTGGNKKTNMSSSAKEEDNSEKMESSINNENFSFSEQLARPCTVGKITTEIISMSSSVS